MVRACKPLAFDHVRPTLLANFFHYSEKYRQLETIKWQTGEMRGKVFILLPHFLFLSLITQVN